MSHIEFRVATRHRGLSGGIHYQECKSIEFANGWMELELKDYPRDQCWIESRTVSAWTKVEQDESNELIINVDIDRYALLADRFREAGETREKMTFMELTELLQLTNSSRNYLLCSQVLCALDALLMKAKA